jgi:hypothetical protein
LQPKKNEEGNNSNALVASFGSLQPKIKQEGDDLLWFVVAQKKTRKRRQQRCRHLF